MEILEELGKDLPLDEVCPICICPLYDFVHTTETLSCLHKYHTQCLKQSWEYHYKNKIL